MVLGAQDDRGGGGFPFSLPLSLFLSRSHTLQSRETEQKNMSSWGSGEGQLGLDPPLLWLHDHQTPAFHCRLPSVILISKVPPLLSPPPAGV